MDKQDIISDVSFEVLKQSFWDIFKATTTAGVVAGVTASPVGITAAVIALAGYIGIKGFQKWEELKNSQEQKDLLQKILETSTDSLKNMPEYHEFFDVKQNTTQILKRVQMLQNVAASSKESIDCLIGQLQKQEDLLKDFRAYIDINSVILKNEIKELITDDLFNKLEELLAKRPTLKNNVLEMEKKNKQYLFFRYQYRWIDFVGREKEFERLDKFLNSKDNLLWWAIIGKGGTGKSRLALELCLRQTERGWYAGFLDYDQKFEAWHGWKPTSPTLIVMDYVDRRVEDLSKRITSLYEQSKYWVYPVRFLLLDRDEIGIWRSNFTKQNKAVIEFHTHYSEDSDTLSLTGLDEKSLISIAEKVFNKYDKSISHQEKQNILKVISSIDKNSRPLYAAFVADASARGKNIRDWDKKQLHDEILSHTKAIWHDTLDIESNEIDRKHYNLLTFATICNGINLSKNIAPEIFVKNISTKIGRNILPGEKDLSPEFDTVKYRLLSGNPCDNRLCSVEPDIIGEYFILEQLQDPKRKYIAEYLWQKAWELYPSETSWFLTLVYGDFANEIDDEQVRPQFLNKNNCVAWTMLLINMIAACGKVGNFEKALKDFNHIKDLWEKIYQKNKIGSLYLSMAAFNLLTSYIVIENTVEADNCFGYIKRAWQAGHENDRDISLVLMNAEFNLINYHSKNHKTIHIATSHFNHIKEIWRDKYITDKEFSLIVAQASKNLQNHYIHVKDFHGLVVCYTHMKEIWDAGYEKDKDISLILIDTICNLILYYSKDSKEDEDKNKAIRYFSYIEDMWQRDYKMDKDISLKVVKAAFVLLCYYGGIDDVDSAIEYLNRIENIWGLGHQNDQRISLALAHSLLNVMAYCGCASKFDKIDKYFDRLDKLRLNGYREDKGISLALAKAALVLAKDLKINNDEATTNYYRKFEDIYSDFKGDKDFEKLASLM